MYLTKDVVLATSTYKEFPSMSNASIRTFELGFRCFVPFIENEFLPDVNLELKSDIAKNVDEGFVSSL
jgi:hypothetical protein